MYRGMHRAGDPCAHRDRGPAKSSGSPATGAAMHSASETVPVVRNPASSTAWVLASVAVITALTYAASLSGIGTDTMMLIVPGR